MLMSESPPNSPRPRFETIEKLLEDKGFDAPVKSIEEYLKAIRTTSERWQEEDWKNTERDEVYLLNNVRIVGQIWFRGHLNCDLSLRPGLYRTGTSKYLRKQPGSPIPPKSDEEANLR
jgi:hypothetical protein